MKQIHFSLKPNRTSKQQALETISKLKSVIPIEKAQMKLKVICPKKHKQKLQEIADEIESEEITDNGLLEIVFLTDPGNYRAVDLLIKDSPKAQLHVVSLKEVVDAEGSVGDLDAGPSK